MNYIIKKTKVTIMSWLISMLVGGTILTLFKIIDISVISSISIFLFIYLMNTINYDDNIIGANSLNPCISERALIPFSNIDFKHINEEIRMDNVDVGIVGKLNLKITIAICIIIFIISLIMLFIIFKDERESIKFSAIIIAGGAAIYSAFYASVSLRTRIFYQNKQLEYKKIQIENEFVRIKHEKSQHSHEFVHLFLSESLVKLRIKLKLFIKEKMQDEGGKNIIISDDLLYKLVSDENDDIMLGLTTSLGLFESLSISIQLGYVDEEVANRNLDFIVVSIFTIFKPYINHVRKINEDEYIYIEAEKLVKSWHSNQYLFSKKDIIYTKER